MSYQGKRFLGVVPARCSSRRIVDKNIRTIAGQPLMTWTLQAAQQARYLEALMVSTDCDKIAQVARQAGIEVPFLRPAELATDEATTAAVLTHALAAWSDYSGETYDYVVVLQPTSPLRTAEEIDAAIVKAVERDAQAIISVSPTAQPPLWMNTLPDDDSMNGFLTPAGMRRSQDLPTYWCLNGAIGVICAQAVRAGQSVWSLSRIYAYRMSREHGVDIDDPLDFLLAEALLQKRLACAASEDTSG